MRAFIFDPRPIGGKPPLDLFWVALSGNSLGLLRGEPAVPQPGVEVSRVEGDVQFPFDQLAESVGGPELGRKTVFSGVLGKPTEDDLLLGAG